MAGKMDKLFNRIGNDKKFRRIIIAVALIGIALLAVSELVGRYDSRGGQQYGGEEYAGYLEHRITELISSVEGVGNVKVLVTLDGDGLGQSAAAVYQTQGLTNAKVKGVLVVCEGGDDYKVVSKLTEAISIALNIGYSQIYITKMN